MKTLLVAAMEEAGIIGIPVLAHDHTVRPSSWAFWTMEDWRVWRQWMDWVAVRVRAAGGHQPRWG